MSIFAGGTQCRGTVLISSIRININCSKQQFNDGTMGTSGSGDKGGPQFWFEVSRESVNVVISYSTFRGGISPKVWVDAINFQKSFNEVCISFSCSTFKCNVNDVVKVCRHRF